MPEPKPSRIFEGASANNSDDFEQEKIISMTVAMSQNGPVIFGLSQSGEVYLYNFPEAKWEHSKIATTRRIFA